jgi:hypothetical protein
MLFLIMISNLHVSLVSAQNSSTQFLSKLEGVWEGKGTAMGAVSDVTMKWEKTLADKFYKISYKMQMSFNARSQLFEGMGLYKPVKEGGYEGTWFDSGGEMHPLKSTYDGKILTTYWGKPGEKYGKTEYEVLDDNTVEVRDAIQNKDGSWRPFAKSTLSRKLN